MFDRIPVISLNVPLAKLEEATNFVDLHSLIDENASKDGQTNTEGYDSSYFSFVYFDYQPGGMSWIGKGQKEIAPYLAVQLSELQRRLIDHQSQREKAQLN